MSDLRRQLMDGRVDLHRVGVVTAATGTLPPFVVVDGAGVEVEPVTRYLRDLALSDMSPLTSRSYGYDLLRWFRVLWALGVRLGTGYRIRGGRPSRLDEDCAQPQRNRTRAGGTPPGVANLRTVSRHWPRATLPARSTIASAPCTASMPSTSTSAGPVVNPVPSSRARRLALAHHSPIEAKRQFKRAGLRQRVADAMPRPSRTRCGTSCSRR